MSGLKTAHRRYRSNAYHSTGYASSLHFRRRSWKRYLFASRSIQSKPLNHKFYDISNGAASSSHWSGHYRNRWVATRQSASYSRTLSLVAGTISSAGFAFGNYAMTSYHRSNTYGQSSASIRYTLLRYGPRSIYGALKRSYYAKS